jgi:hypothetical protein
MSMPNQQAADLLSLICENTDMTGIGDAGGLRGSAVAGSLYVSLHSADPGETGDQTTNEITYTTYARVAITRAGASWNVAVADPATAKNAAAVTFPACTVGSVTASYFGVGTVALPGAGKLLFSGVLSTPLAISPGVTPEFAIDQMILTAD